MRAFEVSRTERRGGRGAPALRGHAAGLTLIECVAAVALLGIALTMAGGLLTAQPRVVTRLAGEQAALRVLEATLESARAGAVPLASGPVALPPGREGDPADLSVSLEVEPGELPGLHRVAAEARFTVRGQSVVRRIETMMWRPR